MRADEATTAAAADGDRAGVFKAIMLEVIFFLSLSLVLIQYSVRSHNLGLQAAKLGKQAEGGGRRLQETRRATMVMIKDQLIRHLLCNLK